MNCWSLALVVAGSLLICPADLAQENATGVDPAWVPPPPGSGVLPAPPMPRAADAPIQYCAYFSDGTSDCGYSALADCEQTVRGVGGWCDVRPQP
jgi:hypothetical protein